MGFEITLNPKQSKFLELDSEKYPHQCLCGGLGSGKSTSLFLKAIQTLMTHKQHIAIYEPTYKLMQAIAIPEISNLLDKIGIKYSLNKSEGIFYTSLSNIYLVSLTNANNIAGYTVLASFCDEIDLLKMSHAEFAYNKLTARNRAKTNNPEYKEKENNFTACACSPEGFSFLYHAFAKPETRFKNSKLIRTSTYDNQDNLPKNFIPNLKDQYPSQLIDAYLYGIFTNLTSHTVYSYFSRDQHVVKQTHVQFTEDVHIGMDFNIRDMAATIITERKNSQGETVWLVIDELVKCRDTDDMIDKIKQKYPRNTIYVYPDASGSRTQSSSMSRSDHSMLRSAGFVVRVNGTNPLIKDRVLSVNNAFDKGKLFVSEGCKNLIEALEQQVYDTNGFPEKDGKDHINDAFGYAVSHLCPVMTNIARYNYIRRI